MDARTLIAIVSPAGTTQGSGAGDGRGCYSCRGNLVQHHLLDPFLRFFLRLLLCSMGLVSLFWGALLPMFRVLRVLLMALRKSYFSIHSPLRLTCLPARVKESQSQQQKHRNGDNVESAASPHHGATCWRAEGDRRSEALGCDQE